LARGCFGDTLRSEGSFWAGTERVCVTAAEDLLNAPAAGDAEALAVLLRRHGPEVRGRLHIAAVWRTALDAADVMQVTYLEAFLRIAQLRARTAEGFVAWLTRLAQNNLHDAIKELERQKRPDPGRRVQCGSAEDSGSSLLDALRATTQTPSRQAARNESQQALENAMARLPPTYAQVVRLHDLEGRSVAEVAAALGRSAGAVYMLRARALQRLQELLGSESRFFSQGA
jgi:RNA polymerase sigma-70 factor (ECF subfamily)